jgi:predicted nucleic-acid-binding Zn-ribbon protein
MKKEHQCPKCESTNLLKINSVAANEETGTRQRQPTFRLAVNGNGSDGRIGELEAYACNDCLYVEFYLKRKLWADSEGDVEKVNKQ